MKYNIQYGWKDYAHGRMSIIQLVFRIRTYTYSVRTVKSLGNIYTVRTTKPVNNIYLFFINGQREESQTFLQSD